MAIQILEIHQSYSDKIIATVNHCGHSFNAYIVGNTEMISRVIGHSITVEISYKHLYNWHRLDNYTDESSCIFSSANDSEFVTIRGRVHNLIDLDDGTFVIDIYLLHGPEFVAVNSGELGDTVLKVGDGIELQVSGISFYPVNT